MHSKVKIIKNKEKVGRKIKAQALQWRMKKNDSIKIKNK